MGESHTSELILAQRKALVHCRNFGDSGDEVVIRVVWIDLALLMVEDAVKVGGAGEHEGHPDEEEHQHPDPAVECGHPMREDEMARFYVV